MSLPYPPAEQRHSSTSFIGGGGFQLISSSPMFNCDGLHELLAAHFPPQSSSNPPPPPDPPADNIKAPAGVSRRRRAARRDRHCKIVTAQGERDRRMRLSLDVARRFFNLQDLLGHDKSSKTVSWLLTKSRSAIKDLSAAFCVAGSGSPAKSENSTLECDELATSTAKTVISISSRKEVTGGGRKARRAHPAGGGFAAPTSKETRARARERARERTREKRRYLSPNEANPANHHHLAAAGEVELSSRHGGHFGYPNEAAGGDVGAVEVAESLFRVNWPGMAAAGMFGGGGIEDHHHRVLLGGGGAIDGSAKPWEAYSGGGGIF